jgi:hypothetical protein
MTLRESSRMSGRYQDTDLAFSLGMNMTLYPHGSHYTMAIAVRSASFGAMGKTFSTPTRQGSRAYMRGTT